MLQKQITYSSQPCILACDTKCYKAWGIQFRPRVQLSQDEDDIAYLADDELGLAPIDPGTYEGGHAKPRTPEGRLNKWCARECERSEIVPVGKPILLPDFNQRRYNQPWKHPEAQDDIEVYLDSGA